MPSPTIHADLAGLQPTQRRRLVPVLLFAGLGVIGLLAGGLWLVRGGLILFDVSSVFCL